MLNDPFNAGFNLGVTGFSELGYLTNLILLIIKNIFMVLSLKLKWNLRTLNMKCLLVIYMGLTDASSNHVFLWNMEVEFN